MNQTSSPNNTMNSNHIFIVTLNSFEMNFKNLDFIRFKANWNGLKFAKTSGTTLFDFNNYTNTTVCLDEQKRAHWTSAKDHVHATQGSMPCAETWNHQPLGTTSSFGAKTCPHLDSGWCTGPGSAVESASLPNAGSKFLFLL